MACLTAFCAYMAITATPYWLFVGIGLLATTVVGVLATSAAFDAVKDW